MKLAIALPALLAPSPVSVLASSADSIARKLRCNKAGKAPPAITLTECGQSFNNTKVVLSNDLDCGEKTGDGFPQPCAVSLVGPQAEINCNGNKLSQDATKDKGYFDGPFVRGICLVDGAKATNCNVEQFFSGIDVQGGGGEVVESNLSSNNFGIAAEFDVNSTLIIENTDASNNVGNGLIINTRSGVEAQLNVVGNVTFNSNGGGLQTFSESNTKLDMVINSDASLNTDDNNDYGLFSRMDPEGAEVNVDVKDTGSFKSCGNGVNGDIFTRVAASSTIEFTGSGYTCEKVYAYGDGTTVKPECQACP